MHKIVVGKYIFLDNNTFKQLSYCHTLLLWIFHKPGNGYTNQYSSKELNIQDSDPFLCPDFMCVINPENPVEKFENLRRE